MNNSTHSERKHSWLSPSGMKPVWAGCLVKPYLEKDLPNTTNKSAEEGTIAHEWASYNLDPTQPKPSQDCPPHLVDEVHAYVEFVQSLMEEGSKLIVEARYDVFADLDISGLTDAIVDNGEHIYVTDLKTGRNEVQVEHNVQLLAYAYGYLQSIGNTNPEVRVFLGIFQYGKANWYETTAGYVQNQFGVRMRDKAFLAKAIYEERKIPTHGDFTAGEHCKWCRAKVGCAAYEKWLSTEAQVSFEVYQEPIPPSVMDNEKLKRIVKVKPMLEQYLEDCLQELKTRAATIEGVDGVEVQVVRGRRTWNKQMEEQIVAFLEENGIEPFETNLIGFTKLSKIDVPDELVTYGNETIKLKVK